MSHNLVDPAKTGVKIRYTVELEKSNNGLIEGRKVLVVTTIAEIQIRNQERGATQKIQALVDAGQDVDHSDGIFVTHLNLRNSNRRREHIQHQDAHILNLQWRKDNMTTEDARTKQ